MKIIPAPERQTKENISEMCYYKVITQCSFNLKLLKFNVFY
jgi:hypothetical protein